MNKAELVDAIANSSGLSKADAKRALDGFISATTGALKKGDRVALVGFGTFSAARGPVPDPGLPGAVFNGKPLRPIKVKHRNGNKSAGTLTLGEDGTWELVFGMPDDSHYDETIELEIKMPKPIEPRLVELSLDLPTASADSSMRSLLDEAAATGEGMVVEISLPPNTFDEFTFDEADPDPDYHAGFYTAVHPKVIDDYCNDDVLADRLGFDGEQVCPQGVSCALDPGTQDQLAVDIAARAGLDPATAAALLDIIRTLVYPPVETPVESLSGFGSFSVSKRAARKGRNPQTGKEIKIAAKKVVKFKAGADLSSKVK